MKMIDNKHWQSAKTVVVRGARPALLTLLLCLIALSSVPRASVYAVQAVQRPISEFVAAQGSTMFFTPPVPDQFGWASAINKPPVIFALFDYAGKASDYLSGFGISLGTEMAGSVTERPLADGRAEVTVVLHTTNALAWAMELDLNGGIEQFSTGPLLFGARAPEIVADPVNNVAALGDSHLRAVFKNSAPGAPLPDLVCLNLGTCPDGFEIISLSFRGNAKGPLHALAGLGPEGTPGMCVVTQTGLLGRGSGKGALADFFPAERVELRAIGR